LEGVHSGPARGRYMLMLLVELSETISVFNVFRYITFRTGGALITAAFIVFLFGPTIIDSLRVRQGRGQPIRADGPQTHFKKAGTPTMGGLMILCGILGSALLWANLSSLYVWVVLMVTVGFGAIGFYDDYLKVTKQSHLGFSRKVGLGPDFVPAGLAAWVVVCAGGVPFCTSCSVACFVYLVVNPGLFFIPFAAFVIVGSGDAVNVTDGVDGLATVPVMVAAASF